MGSWIDGLVNAAAGAAPGWLALGILFHLLNQVSRGCGWSAIVGGACGSARRRDVVAVWVAGAGAGGVLSARGGDAIRVLLLGRRMPESRPSVLTGTLVAEAAGDTLVGAAVLGLAVAFGAAPALGLPGFETAVFVGGALGVAALLWTVARRRAGGRLPPEPGRLRRAMAGVGQGCAPLGRPGWFACHVLPWQVTSRLCRGAAIACFLIAFGLPAGVAAVLLVMLAQTGGRLLPIAPAGAAAAVGMITAGFVPATGAAVSAGAVAAFMVGMSGLLTAAGAALTVAIVGPAGVVSCIRASRSARAAEATA